MEQNINLPLVSDCILTMLNNYNTGISKDQFYGLNIVDATDVSEDDMRSVNAEVIQYCKENGCYAALPPFEEGAFIDRSERRYTHWKVLEVHEDYFLLEFNHYPIIFVDPKYDTQHFDEDATKMKHLCWYRACRVVVKVKLLDTPEHISMLGYHPDFYGMDPRILSNDMMGKLSAELKTQYHVGGVIEDSEYFTATALKKISKKGKYSTSDGTMVNGRWIRDVITDSLGPAMDRGLNSMLFCSSGPIIEMFVYINYMLSKKSTGSSTLRTINSIYALGSGTQEVRKERHFGKISIVSEKKPQVVNATNVQRVYTTIAWQRRSHLRHLASGKVVPVKSAVCKRHNLGDATVPQVIYKA